MEVHVGPTLLSISTAALTDCPPSPNASDHLKWYEDRGRIQLLLYISIIYVGEALVGFDSTIVGKLQGLTIWKSDLGHPNAARIGLLNGMGYITSVLFGPVSAWIADRWGRRWPMRLYSLTMVIGTVIGVCAGMKGVDSYGLFLASRAVTGIGLSTATQTAMIMCQEITHPRSRALVAGAFDQNWAFGNVVASLVVLGTSYINNSWSWRIPYLIQLAPSIYLLVALQIIPESPRFLLAHGRDAEALAFLVKYHGNGNPNDELVLFEFEEMRGTIKMELEAKGTKWTEIMTVPSNRHRLGLAALMAFAYRMSGSAIIQFYYSVILSQIGIVGSTRQSGIGAGLSLFSWICQIGGALGVARTKRRGMLLYTWPALLVLMVGLCASSGVYARSGRENTSAAYATVAMIWLYSGLTSYQAPLLYSYPAEIMSYAIRSKGMAVWTVISQAWGVYSSFVNSIALSKIGYYYYIVYMPLIILQWALMYYYMVETQGYSLEQIAIAFEGKEAKVAIVGAEGGGAKEVKDGEAVDSKTDVRAYTVAI
ncbi:putative hexose transport-related protein [Meredithblackwellia eburnea MCA 4105]